MKATAKNLARVRRNSGDLYDILTDVRRLGSFRWVLRSREFPSNPTNGPSRTSAQIIQSVLGSERVREIIATESNTRQWPIEAVQLEAKNITEEMAHAFDLNSVRTIGFPLGYALKRIYSSIYTQPAQWARVRELSQTTPVIFMPSHRSYLDFLLMSYLCFEFQVPLPAIAAGMDFMGMKLVGEMLRRSGAFFIRRSFGTDRLYWAVFTEYVQTQLRHADRTMEFFVEGTRSRTGKSLHPKYGLLTVLMEPYFRSQLYDMMIVPVSTCYERILEESLYGYELMGFSKPKESTSGLFRAQSVLGTNYGEVVVHLGEPISVREYFSTMSISRNTHALEPNVEFKLTPVEQHGIRRLAHDIVKVQQQDSAVTVWSIASIAINLILASHKDSNHLLATLVHYDTLIQLVDRLMHLANQLGTVELLHAESLTDELEYYLKLHDNLIDSFSREGGVRWLRLLSPETIMQDQAGSQMKLPVLSHSTVNASVSRIILGNYANQALHLFADAALLSAALLLTRQDPIRPDQQLLDSFCRLQSIFVNDFIYVPDPAKQQSTFAQCLGHLQSIGAIQIDARTDEITLLNNETLQFIFSLIGAYVIGYELIVESLADHSAVKFTESEMVHHYQQKVERRLTSISQVGHSIAVEPYMLSTDLAKNALRMCRSAKIVIVDPKDEKYFTVNGGLLNNLMLTVQPLAELLKKDEHAQRRQRL